MYQIINMDLLVNSYQYGIIATWYQHGINMVWDLLWLNHVQSPFIDDFLM